MSAVVGMNGRADRERTVRCGSARVDRDGAALRQPIPQLLTWCGGLTHFGSSSSDRVGFRSVCIRKRWANRTQTDPIPIPSAFGCSAGDLIDRRKIVFHSSAEPIRGGGQLLDVMA